MSARQYRADHLEQVRAKEKQYYSDNPEILLYKCASKRARDRGMACTITADDIRACIPKDGMCPITRQPFQRGEGKVGPRSMTLDRINPTLGYIPGNIAVISHLANTIKQNCADPEVFRRVAAYMEDAMDKCKTCGEPYSEPPTERASFCSSGFHGCRACTRQNGLVVAPCELHDGVCYSCDRSPRAYIDGLCEECHRVALEA